MNTSKESVPSTIHEHSRRTFATKIITSILAPPIAWSVGQPGVSAVMDASTEEAKTFKAGVSLGKEAAINRFKKAQEDLATLIDNYDTISAGGGDSVRRYLGTVGVTSNLYGISKVMKELQEEANDYVEYTEMMNEFASYLNAADTACYSANFVEFSAAKTKPEKFLADALADAKNMQKAMKAMAAELGL